MAAQFAHVEANLVFAHEAGIAMSATYIYAIIPTRSQVAFEAAGLDDDQEEVYTLAQGDLAAVVSASPLADYRGLKRDEAVRYLIAHQRVVEEAMRAFPVLPLRFGTVLPNKEWVRRFLREGSLLFHASLQKIMGMVQMEVVVLCKLPAIFQEIAQEETIARLKAELAALPAEKTTAGRIALGQMVQHALTQRRTTLRDRLLPRLQEGALDAVSNPLMDDSMVLNIALLLDEKGRQALEKRLEVLDAEYGGQLTFRCVGPLPPYSFATIEVQKPTYEAIDEARRQLGLGEMASLEEIKHAYRQLAAQLHPDHNQQDAQAETRMAALTQAYRLLTVYAESQTARGGMPTATCSLGRQAVEQSLLIAIRRQESNLTGF